MMQVKMVIIPSDDGLNVVIWGKWKAGSMRVRSFDNRTEMLDELEGLSLISVQDRPQLEDYIFTDSCPLFSAEVEEEELASHGFDLA